MLATPPPRHFSKYPEHSCSDCLYHSRSLRHTLQSKHFTDWAGPRRGVSWGTAAAAGFKPAAADYQDIYNDVSERLTVRDPTEISHQIQKVAPPTQTIPTISNILLTVQSKCGESAEESGGVRSAGSSYRETSAAVTFHSWPLQEGSAALRGTRRQRYGPSVLSVLCSFILLHVESRQALQKVATTFILPSHIPSLSPQAPFSY